VPLTGGSASSTGVVRALLVRGMLAGLAAGLAAFLFAYVLDAPVILIPVLLSALPRRELGKALASFPSYFPLRVANAVMMLKAAFLELVLRRPFRVYEKGH